MLQDLDALHLGPTVDARDKDVRTSCLVLVDFLADALGLAQAKGLAFDGLIRAVLIVVLYVAVRKHRLTPQ